jgi:hypothetical protein
MPTLNCQIPQSLQKVLEQRCKESGESIDHLVASTLSRCLDVPLHTLFQISTSGALVRGIYERAVSSSFLLNYGDSETNDLLVSQVIRTNELHVWIIAEHLVDIPLVRVKKPIYPLWPGEDL